MDSQFTVKHLPEEAKYVIYDGEKHIGLLAYVELKDRVKNFFHTEIDPSYGGQGLGKLLVETALKDAEADQIKIQPSCPFVHGFIQKNPQYENLVR
jgi:predicted GNAT family acetyltransferase